MKYKTAEEYYLEVDAGLDEISKEELINWKHHPITKLLVKSLQGDIQYRVEAWGDGDYLKQSVEETALINAKAVGEINTMRSTIEWIEYLGGLS
jgi:hypothetical protein